MAAIGGKADMPLARRKARQRAKKHERVSTFNRAKRAQGAIHYMRLRA